MVGSVGRGDGWPLLSEEGQKGVKKLLGRWETHLVRQDPCYQWTSEEKGNLVSTTKYMTGFCEEDLGK